AVAHRRDQPDLRQAEEPRQGLTREALVDVADRGPIEFGEFAVDAASGAFEFAPERAILPHLAARMGRDLEIAEALAQRRMLAQQAFDRLEAVGDALAVIEPVDADD